jgi:hypothetical protein
MQGNGLFNTTILNQFSPSAVNSFKASDPQRAALGELTFAIKKSALPVNFDGRTYPAWTDANGFNSLEHSTDQAGCGSCWAFSASSAYTDRIRVLLQQNKGSKNPALSPFYKEVQVLTGESTIDQAVNPQASATPLHLTLSLTVSQPYTQTIYDEIGPYYTAGFSPKITADCQAKNAADAIAQCIDSRCQGKAPSDPSAIKQCSGCEGNYLYSPLLLFGQSGGARQSTYGLRRWACVYGAPQYCTDSPFKGPLYKVSKYVYFNSNDLQGNLPANAMAAGITNMEDYLMMELINRGPMAVSFQVYPSFFNFFKSPSQDVYTSLDPNENVEGGHAVVLIGWGVDQRGNKYWLIKNSWGEKWNGDGTFKILRGSNFCEIEGEVAAVLLFKTDLAQFYDQGSNVDPPGHPDSHLGMYIFIGGLILLIIAIVVVYFKFFRI